MGSDSIKRYVQNKSSGRYYAAGGLWVDGVQEARSFSSTLEVIEEMGSGAWERGYCELVLKFDGLEGNDTRLSL